MSNTSSNDSWWQKKRIKIDPKRGSKRDPLAPRPGDPNFDWSFGDPHYDRNGNPLPPPGHPMHPGYRNR